jgi:hypothetical protein
MLSIGDLARHPRHKVMYILHVEVEHRLHAEHELLRDIRLVIRKPAAAPLDIEAAARKIVGSCLAALVLDRTDDASVRDYCAQLFGWGSTV